MARGGGGRIGGGGPRVPSAGSVERPRSPTLRLPAMMPIKPQAASTRLYGKVGNNAPNFGASAGDTVNPTPGGV